MSAFSLRNILLGITGFLGLAVIGLAGEIAYDMAGQRTNAKYSEEVNLVGDLLGCGRRAGHHRRPPEPVSHLRQPEVVGAEVVSPLGETVRLVDRQKVDFTGGEQLQEGR